MLEIYLFGSFEVKRDTRSLCTHWTRGAHRLLALLTLNHNRAVSTDWVISSLMMPDLVFPQSLSVLYGVLGSEDRGRIHHKNRQIHFDTSGVRVDLFEFEKLVGKDTPEALEAAIKMHGGGLLKDWEEEAWFSEERENSLAEYLDTMNSLTRQAMDVQDYERAASLLRRHVNAYPEMDAAWTRLVEVYALAEDRVQIEKAKARYLAALNKRSEEEGMALFPSRRFLQACEVPARSESPAVVVASPPFKNVSASAGAAVADPVRAFQAVLEPVGGAVPPDSPYYLSRPADDLAWEALARRDSFLLIKGARQVGKSSLLARLYRKARESGVRVVRSDWQKIPQAALETDRTFLGAMADTLTDYLELESTPQSHFVPGRAGTTSFERFLRRDVLPAVNGPLVWFIDEADRLFDRPFRDDVFAMLRSWHGERAIDESGRWNQFTVVLAYATEAYLFISNLDQSPFNVGTRIELDDFTFEQVGEMNRRYGSPLRDEAEAVTLFALVGGHPYLVRRCLQEMVQKGLNIAEIEARAGRSDALFNDHLGRLRVALQRDPEMLEALRTYLSHGIPPDFDTFLRLRAAGVVRGESPREMSLRCLLYELSLRRAFL